MSPNGTVAGEPGASLRREVGLAGAVLLGLGSMVGTGVFVSIGIAAGVAGPALLLSIVLAALLAAANGLSSAQLAAAHPVSGGTYEYGYRWLSPALGFSAGWMFLLAKGASAATAALGLSGYALRLLGIGAGWRHTAIAAAAVLAITAFVTGGIRRSNRGNAVVVSVTLGGLVLLIACALPTLLTDGPRNLTPFFRQAGGHAGSGAVLLDSGAVLHGAALMFVAFTGYARIATLGEEVREPQRVIPRAIVLTMLVVTVLYLGVAATGLGVLGAEAFGHAAEASAAPLAAVASALRPDFLPGLVAVAAMTAMAGVLLNLVLGLSRVLLAMARRRDAPVVFARVHAGRASPRAAVWACGLGVAALTLVGSVRVTWSFSAFTILVYYAITNLAALRLPRDQRLFPRWIAAAGLAACLSLAFWVEVRVWAVGLGLLVLGFLGHRFARSVRSEG